MDRSTPEDEQYINKPKMVPAKTTTSPGFMNQDKLKNLKNTATSRRLKARVLQAKNGTAHEQHVAHQQHMQHVQNTAMKNQKSKNPYST